MKKYIISIILLAIPMFASAYDCQVGGIYFNLISWNNAEVTSGDTEYSGAVSIPQMFRYNNVYIVTSIGNAAFSGCSGLTSVTIPNSVTSIESQPFTGCSGLTSIKVESGNTNYDSRNNCNAIIETSTNTLIAGCKNTVIPNSVTGIGFGAFYGHSGLTSITIPNSVTSIGWDAFGSCIGLTSIKVENGNTKYDSRNNCNAIIETSTNTLIAGCKNTVIPNSVTSIGNYAFHACSSLTSVTIPNSVTSIGNDAFYNCDGLTSVTIPISVTSIGQSAFGYCSSLKEVTSEINNPQQVSLGTNVFSYIPSGAILYVPAGTKSSYEAISGWKNSFSKIVEIGGGGIAVDETNFPDDAFRNWVLNNIPGASDGLLTDEEIAAVSKIDCSGTEGRNGNIQNMKGIEFFTNLNYLFCSNNRLTSLDVTKNTALRELYCDNNQLTTLDVTKNTELTDLYCENNQLTALDVTKNMALTILYCSNNQLTALDVTKNMALTGLICDDNQLIALNVTKNTALENLYCPNNRLTALDVTKNMVLESLSCSNNKLTALDVTKNTALVQLSCDRNQLTALDVTKNTVISYLKCSNNQLTTLDVTKNTALRELYCDNNQLTTLDVTKNTALSFLYCHNNKLLNLSLYYNTSISSSYVRLSNQIFSLTAVDISAGIAIPVPSDFNYSKVSNMRLAGVSVTGKTTTVNSQKYLVFAATGTAQSNINGKLLYYEYDTDNSAAGKMAVDVTLSYTAPDNPVTITANSYTITYGDPLPTFGYTTTGSALVGTPTITCSATSSSNAGTYDIIVSKGSVSNSSITYVKGTLTIKKATLTASVGNYTRKQGEANPTFTISYSGFKNGENKSVLIKEPTASCSATSSSAPGSYPININGGEAINYEFKYKIGYLTVTAADAVVVTAKDYTITYGDALPKFEYTVSGGTYNGTPKITCSATSSSDAGTYDINIAAGSGTNYNVTYVKGTLTIRKATLTASVGNYTRKQGEANPTFTISYSGFKNNQTKSVLTREPSVNCSATSSSAPGSYPITLSGGEAKNYEFNYQSGVLTIEQRDAVTVTANSYTIEYGDPLPNFGYTTTGATLKGKPTISCSATSSSNAGTYTITVSKGSVSNEEATFVNGTLTIRKATLTASVGSYTKKQGDAMPTFSISYSGFKNGETKSVLTREPTASCSATASSAPGSYPITLSGGEAQNYEFNYQNGTLTVIAADAAAVTARSYTITYGDPLPQFEYDTSGVALNGTPAISCAATANSNAGTYDIVVSKGSVSNYNVSYVNGTLTIRKAVLTASVGEYTRKPGEDNPKFTITYNGFKKDQTKSVLDSEPTARCEATKDSPSGTYPITLSGGSAKNYEFKYENGVLKVLNGYTLSIMSIGKGTTLFGTQTVSQNNSINATVYSGEQYTVTFKPDKGYKLGKLLWNDKDVIAEVTNNTYKISNVSQTSTLIAMYEESLGEFTAGGITYEILSGSENTVTVTKGNYTGQIEIPAAVTDNGIKWSVVGIQNFAFSNTPILTVIIPESVVESNMGGGIFSGCQNLAAITWNANFAVTGNMLSGLSNPNLLIYTKNAAYAPSSVKNVVVNGTAEEITLTDAEGSNNFYCPTEFTARKISYTHNYRMTSGFGGKPQGWETIALPFDVKEIRHASKGTVMPFAAWNNSTSAKPFWLYSLSAGGFSRASSIQANTPYIICMPNNEEYDTDYILSGAVTFSATDAKVKVSSATNSGKSGTKTFIPAFCAQEKSGGVYALNVNNDIHSERGGYDEGSRFVSNLRTVSPFEAYMTDSSAGAKQTIDIEFSDATGIDELTGDSESGTSVYTIMGQKVKSERLNKGTLPQGIYIKNGKKVSVK